MNIKVGIIGGSGLDDPNLFKKSKEIEVKTPYGAPSDILREGQINDVNCVLLARHGRKHNIMPGNINYRANLWALRDVGCTHVVVSTACGSLREEIRPGDFVIIDQFIDRTTKRAQTFYDGAKSSPKGILHIPMDNPFCSHTRQLIVESCIELSKNYHDKGTMVTIEGPRFSSRAESKMFRAWGCDVINMTTCPEVVLARELGLCYAAVGMATDYDCWREGEEAVSVEKVMATFKTNAANVQEILKSVITKIAKKDWSDIITKLKSDVASNIMT